MSRICKVLKKWTKRGFCFFIVLAVLGLCCGSRALCCSTQAFSCCRAGALEHMGSVVATFSLSCPAVCGIKLVSPALEEGFLTSIPSRRSLRGTFKMLWYAGSVGLPWWLSSKKSAYKCRRLMRHGFNPWVGKIPWRRKWQPTLLFLPWKSHGQRSLASCNPWDCKESDATEQASIIYWEHRGTKSFRKNLKW